MAIVPLAPLLRYPLPKLDQVAIPEFACGAMEVRLPSTLDQRGGGERGRPGSEERGSEGAKERGGEGAREPGSEGARERGSEGARGGGSEGAR